MARWGRDGLLGLSVITHLEVYRGMKSANEEATGTFLDRLVAVPLDASLARRAGSLVREQRSKGITVGIADAIIAATALALGVPLLTNNVKHYVFPGLHAVRGAEG